MNALRAYREKRQLTQLQLAYAANVSLSTICRWEHCELLPPRALRFLEAATAPDPHRRKAMHKYVKESYARQDHRRPRGFRPNQWAKGAPAAWRIRVAAELEAQFGTDPADETIDQILDL